VIVVATRVISVAPIFIFQFPISIQVASFIVNSSLSQTEKYCFALYDITHNTAYSPEATINKRTVSQTLGNVFIQGC
jgi:hypothetical protein